MMQFLPLVVLFACGDPPPTPEGPRTVSVHRIDVSLDVSPDPGFVEVEDPDWLHMHHCGSLTRDGDFLHAHGGLSPKIEAVAMIRYVGWGSLFSGGGTEELELDITHGAEVVAALDASQVLYELAPEDLDTGVPGGEQRWSYPAKNLPDGTIATETHAHHPVQELVLVEEEPRNCAR